MYVVRPHRTPRAERRTAHPAVTAGLTLALATGSMLLPRTPALAENGRVTITQQHNANATYDAYCVFTADIDANDAARHVDWSDQQMRTVVVDYLRTKGYADWLATHHQGEGQDLIAQNAAEFIAEQIGASSAQDGTATKPQTTMGKSFAQGLAQALASSNSVSKRTAQSGREFTGAEGYWLFVTATSTLDGDNEAGTVPIWVPLGGSTTAIDEKSSVPTVTKDVREDSTGAWGKVADAHTGQELDYRLSATLPDNYHSYDRYHLRFTDTLSSGLSIATPASGTLGDAVFLVVGNVRRAASSLPATVTLAGNVLTIDIADLKDTAWDAFHITDSSVVQVEYQAHLNDSAAYGPEGNANGVRLTYSNDPVSEGTGHTTDVRDTTKTFAYQLSILKVDKQTNEPLGNASFTLQVAASNGDAASRGKYVQADGSLGTDAHSFSTGSDGTFSVAGIDEGVYTLHEVSAPQGYATMGSDMTLTITSTLNETDRTLTSLTASVVGHDSGDTSAHIVSAVTGVDDAAGRVGLKVTDDRWLTMPLTGLGGLGASSLVGVSLATVAVGGHLLRRRHLG